MSTFAKHLHGSLAKGMETLAKDLRGSFEKGMETLAKHLHGRLEKRIEIGLLVAVIAIGVCLEVVFILALGRHA